MTAGRLAAAKPGATTNTSLYRCNIDNTASAVLTATNQGGSATTYRAAVRNYDQILTMDGDEPSTLEFAKGNPISNYKLKISPGISFSDATPGADITSTSGATAKLLDVFKDTANITRYVQVDKVLSTETNVDNLIGLFEIGETVTGGTSSFTGTVRSFDNTTGTLNMSIADVSNSATSIKVSRNTGLAIATKLFISDDPTATGTEIIQIDPSGIDTATNTLTVTRGVHGTTASAIPAGAYAKSFIESATTSTINEGATFAAADLTLTLTDATGFLEGSYILIGNEIAGINAVAGNDITIDRGRYGTSAVDHSDGATVTQLTDSGDYYLNFFTELETITGGTSNAQISMNFTQGSNPVPNQDRFIISTSSSGPFEYPLPGATIAGLDNERTYIYDQSHVSNTGHTLRLSEEQDGTQGLTGVEYTTGVTKTGTAGSNGLIQIDITDSTPLSLNIYAEPAVANVEDANAGFGHSLETSLDPEYQEIFIYKLGGEAFAAADTFDLAGVTYTVQTNGVTAGSYGYVHDWDATRNVLKVSLDIGSPAFAVGDTFYDTPTRANENRYMAEIVTGKILAIDTVGAADASRSAGTYDVSPTGGTGSGAKVQIVVDGSGAATVTLVNGGKDYADGETLTATDAVLGGGGGANLTFAVDGIGTGDKAGATATTYANAEDFIHYDTALAANTLDRTTGIVVGPGQNVLVYSGSADVAYSVSGFESASDDYTIILNTKSSDDGGGGVTP